MIDAIFTYALRKHAVLAMIAVVGAIYGLGIKYQVQRLNKSVDARRVFRQRSEAFRLNIPSPDAL